MAEAIAINDGNHFHFDRIVYAKFGEKRGFLLSQDVETHKYYAHYPDGVVEEIINPSGDPTFVRPTPEPSPRSRGWKVPTGFPTQVASQFTGLMRQVVGTYHARSIKAPFGSNVAKCQGIVKTTVTIGSVLVDRYWVVEIGPTGVFAAPIPTSWNIKAYTPTGELNLHIAYDENKTGVIRLLDEEVMSPVYNNRLALFQDGGWAFSATGQFAQIIFFRSTHLPAFDFPGASPGSRTERVATTRYKIEFLASGINALVAELTVPEVDKRLATGRTFFQLFSDSGVYSNFQPQSDFRSFTNNPEDAPVLIYYSGELEVICRHAVIAGTGGFFGFPVAAGFFVTIDGVTVTNTVTVNQVGADGPLGFFSILTTFLREREGFCLIAQDFNGANATIIHHFGASKVERSFLENLPVFPTRFTYKDAGGIYDLIFRGGFTQDPEEVVTNTAHLSTINLMHGNMVRLDPRLVPADQTRNAVYTAAVLPVTEPPTVPPDVMNVPLGGFTQLEGKSAIAFVGKV